MFGIVSLIVLALDIYTIYLVLQQGMAADKKLLWILVIVLLPIAGPLLYFILGRA
jgi:hypothetical protein